MTLGGCAKKPMTRNGKELADVVRTHAWVGKLLPQKSHWPCQLECDIRLHRQAFAYMWKCPAHVGDALADVGDTQLFWAKKLPGKART